MDDIKIDKKLIAECTAYDFKSALERKKVRDWLKSICAFANGKGGSLFFGVDNEGSIIGLDSIQSDAEFISKYIKDRIDPVPDFELIPYLTSQGRILEVKVKEGELTPYFYYADGTRTTFVRQGEESCVANSQQLLSLILRGKHSSYDAIKTEFRREDMSFVILANAYKERTKQEFEEKLLTSFGLVSFDGFLTNAGLLFADNCPVYQSRLYCTRWNGLHKEDAIHDAEYKGNLLMLLNYGCEFVKTFTYHGWKKASDRRKNFPDYSERAVMEAVVNHLIHRDYTVIGSEVHIDIFDDRLELYSPGGMCDGTFIQDYDIESIPSKRRNPVIADVLAQLDYMEKRGSGLRKIRKETAMMPNYTSDKAPFFRSSNTEFFTIIKNVNYSLEGNNKNAVSTPEVHQKYTRSALELSKTQRQVLDQLILDPYATREQIATVLSISTRGVSKVIAQLKEMHIIERIGYTKGGHWKIIEE